MIVSSHLAELVRFFVCVPCCLIFCPSEPGGVKRKRQKSPGPVVAIPKKPVRGEKWFYAPLQSCPFKGVFQPFELGAKTSLIRSAVKFFKAGHFQKFFLMIQSHEWGLKPISAA